jgi:hypothetical protein
MSKPTTYTEFLNLYLYLDRDDVRQGEEMLQNLRKGFFQDLDKQRRQYGPEGWVLVECEQLDSSRLGERVVLPFGENNTLKKIPVGPVSPRGMASDMSVVVAVLYRDQLPERDPHAE